jgi:hypothetical protein
VKYFITAMSSIIVMLCSGVLSGQPAECRKKCDENFTACSNRCMVMAADNTGCGGRCEKERDRCAGACESVRKNSAGRDFDLDDDLENEDPDGEYFDDLENLEDLDNNFDGVDGMMDDGWDDLNDRNVRDLED